MKIIRLLRFILLLAIIVTLSNTIVAQVSVRVGAGFPDYFNATYYYNFEQRAIGIGAGVDPIADELMISFKGDFYYTNFVIVLPHSGQNVKNFFKIRVFFDRCSNFF